LLFHYEDILFLFSANHDHGFSWGLSPWSKLKEPGFMDIYWALYKCFFLLLV